MSVTVPDFVPANLAECVMPPSLCAGDLHSWGTCHTGRAAVRLGEVAIEVDVYQDQAFEDAEHGQPGQGDFRPYVELELYRGAEDTSVSLCTQHITNSDEVRAYAVALAQAVTHLYAAANVLDQVNGGRK
jgi:hypothetical protein